MSISDKERKRSEGFIPPDYRSANPEPPAIPLEEIAAQLEAKLQADGYDPDVLTIKGTLLMRPEPEVRAALAALDRLAAPAIPEQPEDYGTADGQPPTNVIVPQPVPLRGDMERPDFAVTRVSSGGDGTLICPRCQAETVQLVLSKNSRPAAWRARLILENGMFGGWAFYGVFPDFPPSAGIEVQSLYADEPPAQPSA